VFAELVHVSLVQRSLEMFVRSVRIIVLYISKCLKRL
jgi:hypothetical protein